MTTPEDSFDAKDINPSEKTEFLKKAVEVSNKDKTELKQGEDYLREMIRKGGDGFLSDLRNLRLKIMLRDARELRKEGKYRPLLPVEEQVPVPEMCGYSACAITESFRELLGEGAVVRTVFGHYTKDGQRDDHYWTEVTIKGERYFICATYGQFDGEYQGRILLDRAENLEQYGLLEYRAGSGGTDLDESTVKALQQNQGNLPVDLDTDESVREEFEKLRGSFTREKN